MVLNPEIFNYIQGDSTIFEREPLEKVAEDDNLFCYKHSGFWQCMDTKWDMDHLNEMWEKKEAPWKVW